MKLIEGSVVPVNCVECGDHMFSVVVMSGKQRMKCPECGRTTIVEFTRSNDGRYQLETR